MSYNGRKKRELSSIQISLHFMNREFKFHRYVYLIIFGIFIHKKILQDMISFVRRKVFVWPGRGLDFNF